MTGLQGRSQVNPFADRRIDQLASLLSEDRYFAQLFATFTAFSGTLRFPFRISVPAFDSIPGTQASSPVRKPGEQHQYLISYPRDSYSRFRVAPVTNDKII